MSQQQYILVTNYVPKPQRKAYKAPNPYEQEVIDHINAVWGVHAERAIVVARCESGLDPFIINDNPGTKDYSVGIFQINLYGDLAKNRPPEAWLLDYRNNIEYAYKMFLASGWTPWTCAR